MVSRDCERFEEAISAACDDALDAADRADLDHHLLRCAACRELAEGFELIDAGLRAVAPVTPKSLHESVARALRTTETADAADAPPVRRVGPPLLHLVAAALLAIGAVAIFDPASSSDAVGGELPIAEIGKLQRRAVEDQSLMMETLQWELRAMRLEVRALGEGAGDAGPVLKRIDRLLASTTTSEPHEPKDPREGENR